MKILHTITFLVIIILTTAVIRRIWWIEYKKRNNIKCIIFSNFIEIATVIGHVIFILLLSAMFMMENTKGIIIHFFWIAIIGIYLFSKVLYKLFYRNINQYFEEKRRKKK